MFNAWLPQLLGGFVICQLEADRGLVLLKLPWADFDVEVVSLVWDFENFRPSEAIDAQPEEGRTDKTFIDLQW